MIWLSFWEGHGWAASRKWAPEATFIARNSVGDNLTADFKAELAPNVVALPAGQQDNLNSFWAPDSTCVLYLLDFFHWLILASFIAECGLVAFCWHRRHNVVGRTSQLRLTISIDAVYKFINEYTGSKIPQHDIQNQSASKCLDMVRHAKGGLPIVKLNELPKPGGISQDHCPVDLSRNWKLIASEDPFNPGGCDRNCFQRACVLCLGRPWTDNRMLTDVAYSSSHVSPSLQSSTVKFFCCSCPCCFSPSLRLSPGAVPWQSWYARLIREYFVYWCLLVQCDLMWFASCVFICRMCVLFEFSVSNFKLDVTVMATMHCDFEAHDAIDVELGGFP